MCALQRRGVAVVEVQAERLGVELVDEARRPAPPAAPGSEPSIAGGCQPWKWRRVRVRSLVQEVDPDAVPLGGADRRPRHLAVERPGGEKEAGGDLDLAVHGVDLVLAQQRPSGRGVSR